MTFSCHVRKPSRRSPPVGVSDANSTRVTGGDSGSSSRRDNSRSPSRQRHQDSRDSRSDKSLLPPEAFNKQRDRSPIGRQRSPHSNRSGHLLDSALLAFCEQDFEKTIKYQRKIVGFFTNTLSMLASVVFDSVLGPPHLTVSFESLKLQKKQTRRG